MSDMQGTKAMELERYRRSAGQAFTGSIIAATASRPAISKTDD